MIPRSLSRIAETVGGRVHGEDVTVGSAASDSRAAAPGSLFIALPGERVDGHDFVAEAVRRGAAAALVTRPIEGVPCVVVADTGVALLALAADERDRTTDATIVGITGANGKTSTKDMAAEVLGTRYRIHASPASFNTEVGLPVTLLGAPPGTEVVVAEMGARRLGDVALLCRIARPDLVVVTNVGVAHMGIFGSWDAIVTASAEPVEAIGDDGVAILNRDDDVVRSYADRTRARVLWFGQAAGADVRAERIEMGDDGRARFLLRADGAGEPVELGVPGEHMVANALAAAACGLALGVDPAASAAALEGARLTGSRMEAFDAPGGITVVNDAYNASPESMAAALKTARWMAREGRLVAVLGHMAELGEISVDAHDKLGETIVRVGVDRLITVGEEARLIHTSAVREGQHPDDAVDVQTADEAVAELRRWLRPGDVVLVKGSRVLGLERVAEALR